MEPENSIVLKKIQNGDISAFEILYKDLHPRMLAYAKRFIPDTEVIKDILQEVFLDFWKRKEELTITISLSAFLFKMLHNRCIDYLRNQVVKDHFTSLASLRVMEVKYRYFDFETDPFPTIFMGEINAIVEKTLNSLSPQAKEIFRMSRQQGMKNSEIAEKIHLSIRTVEKYIYQTLKILKKDLSDYQ